MSEESKLTQMRGKHAQNALALTMKAIALDWDKDSRKRAQLILELHALDQKMAGYEQVHRELSAAAALVDQFAAIIPGPEWGHENTPEHAGEFDQHQRPTAALARYKVTLSPVEGLQ